MPTASGNGGYGKRLWLESPGLSNQNFLPARKVTDAKARVDRKITHRLSAERPLHAGFAVSEAESKRLLSPKTPGGGRSDAVKRLEAMIAYEAGKDITNQQGRGLHMDSGAHRLTDANYRQQSSSKHSVFATTDCRPLSEFDMLSNSLENRRDISPPGPRIRSSLHAASHIEHGEASQSPESMPQSMLVRAEEMRQQVENAIKQASVGSVGKPALGNARQNSTPEKSLSRVSREAGGGGGKEWQELAKYKSVVEDSLEKFRKAAHEFDSKAGSAHAFDSAAGSGHLTRSIESRELASWDSHPPHPMRRIQIKERDIDTRGHMKEPDTDTRGDGARAKDNGEESDWGRNVVLEREREVETGGGGEEWGGADCNARVERGVDKPTMDRILMRAHKTQEAAVRALSPAGVRRLSPPARASSSPAAVSNREWRSGSPNGDWLYAPRTSGHGDVESSLVTRQHSSLLTSLSPVYGNARDVIGRAPSPLSRRAPSPLSRRAPSPLSRPLSSPHSRETGEDARAGAAWRDRGRAPWADSAAPRPPTSDSAAARPRPHSAAARPPTSSPSHVLVREGHGERGERGGLASGREGGRREGNRELLVTTSRCASSKQLLDFLDKDQDSSHSSSEPVRYTHRNREWERERERGREEREGERQRGGEGEGGREEETVTGQDRDGPKDRVVDRFDRFIDRGREKGSQRERDREGDVERNRDRDRDGMQIFESARLRFEAQKQLWVVDEMLNRTPLTKKSMSSVNHGKNYGRVQQPQQQQQQPPPPPQERQERKEHVGGMAAREGEGAQGATAARPHGRQGAASPHVPISAGQKGGGGGSGCVGGGGAGATLATLPLTQTIMGHASDVHSASDVGGGGGGGAEHEDDDCGGEDDDVARLTDEMLTHDRIHASAAHDRIHASAAAHAQLHAESLLRRSGMDVGARSHLAPHHAPFSPEHKEWMEECKEICSLALSAATQAQKAANECFGIMKLLQQSFPLDARASLATRHHEVRHDEVRVARDDDEESGGEPKFTQEIESKIEEYKEREGLQSRGEERGRKHVGSEAQERRERQERQELAASRVRNAKSTEERAEKERDQRMHEFASSMPKEIERHGERDGGASVYASVYAGANAGANGLDSLDVSPRDSEEGMRECGARSLMFERNKEEEQEKMCLEPRRAEADAPQSAESAQVHTERSLQGITLRVDLHDLKHLKVQGGRGRAEEESRVEAERDEEERGKADVAAGKRLSRGEMAEVAAMAEVHDLLSPSQPSGVEGLGRGLDELLKHEALAFKKERPWHPTCSSRDNTGKGGVRVGEVGGEGLGRRWVSDETDLMLKSIGAQQQAQRVIAKYKASPITTASPMTTKQTRTGDGDHTIVRRSIDAMTASTAQLRTLLSPKELSPPHLLPTFLSPKGAAGDEEEGEGMERAHAAPPMERAHAAPRAAPLTTHAAKEREGMVTAHAHSKLTADGDSKAHAATAHAATIRVQPPPPPFRRVQEESPQEEIPKPIDGGGDGYNARLVGKTKREGVVARGSTSERVSASTSARMDTRAAATSTPLLDHRASTRAPLLHSTSAPLLHSQHKRLGGEAFEERDEQDALPPPPPLAPPSKAHDDGHDPVERLIKARESRDLKISQIKSLLQNLQT